jgi:hypothetical protein
VTVLSRNYEFKKLQSFTQFSAICLNNFAFVEVKKSQNLFYLRHLNSFVRAAAPLPPPPETYNLAFLTAQTLSGDHPSSCSVNNGECCCGLKQQKREAYHLSPYSTEIKNA